jgi:signal transduction histidine kinase
MRLAWQRRGHLIVEPTRTWGITETSVRTPEELAAMMARRELGSWLLVPIGMGEEYLGAMGLGRRPGGPRWIDSEVNAAVAVAGDVADLVFDARLMERERRLNEELRDVDDYRRDMINTLAHELRNPVTVLWTHLELLGDEDVPTGVRDSLQAMDRAARRIEDMVEDLMTLGKVSDPARATTRTTVDLSALGRECVDFVAAVAEAGGLELRTDVATGIALEGDELGLQRLVANLLSNAIKYTQPGGRVTLTLADGERDGVRGALLTCADTGLGIDPDDRDRVFTPFYRSGSHGSRRRPGTGLGLAIVDQVVQRHGGRIELDSRIGEGSRFTVWLPLAPDVGVR